MRLHFLGIGGTLMGSLAQLAKEQGHEVTGSDQGVHPPMSDLLAAAGIKVHEGFSPGQLRPAPDLVVIGNAGLPRGVESVEHILNSGLRYVSGAEWLGANVLHDRWVLAVSGTHGKTTTAAMLAWILERAGLNPGYLIGGAPKNFDRSARLGHAPYFVTEADEYDCSYFDRRSKFVHYRPRTLIINNLEYDHADIFEDLAAIKAQFRLLLRTVPGEGLIVAPSGDENVNDLLLRDCWTPVSRFGAEAPKQAAPTENGDRWAACNLSADLGAFDVCLNDNPVGRVVWPLTGAHNVGNALAATAAARHVGVPPKAAIAALSDFAGVRRRLEVIAQIGRTTLYDDFAHHPTAIRATLQGLRNRVGNEEIVAIIEPRTHTMSLGALRRELATCCAPADQAVWFRSANIQWDLGRLVAESVTPARQFADLEQLIDWVKALPERRRHLVIMSNGRFDNICEKLPAALMEQWR